MTLQAEKHSQFSFNKMFPTLNASKLFHWSQLQIRMVLYSPQVNDQRSRKADLRKNLKNIEKFKMNDILFVCWLRTLVLYLCWQSVSCFEVDRLTIYNPYQYIMTISGYSNGEYYTAFNMYGDGPSVTLPPSPQSQVGAQAMFPGNVLYIANGVGPDQSDATGFGVAYKLDLSNLTNIHLVKIPSVPASQYCSSAVNIDNRYFTLFGGTAGGFVYAYDVVNSFWSSWQPSLPSSLHCGNAEIINSYVYYVGGSGGDPQAVWRAKKTVFSSSKIANNTNKWEQMASLNLGRSSMALVRYEKDDGKKLIAIGGEGALFSVEIYDVDKNTWSVANGLNVGRYESQAVLIPDSKKILTCGGYYQTALDSCETYDMCSQNPSWQLLSNFRLASPLYAFGMVVVDNTPPWYSRPASCQSWYGRSSATMPPCKLKVFFLTNKCNSS